MAQPTTRECLKHARMLTPKFCFKDENGWHIHWPKDTPTVVHAATQEELIVVLASWLERLGRVSNQGKHVDPEYPKRLSRDQ